MRITPAQAEAELIKRASDDFLKFIIMQGPESRMTMLEMIEKFMQEYPTNPLFKDHDHRN